MSADRVGNTMLRAKLLRLAPTAIAQEQIGGKDRSDFYRFRLKQRSSVQIELETREANADLALFSRSRRVLKASRRADFQSEAITETLRPGVYFLRVSASGDNTSYQLVAAATLQAELAPKPLQFKRFTVADASGDSTANTLFQSGALRWSYELSDKADSVRLEVWQNEQATTIATADGLVNLAQFSNLSGDVQVRAVATQAGQEFTSDSIALRILPWQDHSSYGTSSAETLFANSVGSGQIVVGRGGTDTLSLDIDRASVSSLNGQSLELYDPFNSTTSQAIFQGTAYDHLTLVDGRELYLQGIEALRFVDQSLLDLQVRPNDRDSGGQWNLHTTDVNSAWRFTQGSDRVLLVSLDTGILTAPGASGGVRDLDSQRLLVDPSDDDNYRNNGHGHQAISIMAATANNAEGIAGINWKSQVMVSDVYYGTTVRQAIADALAYGRSTGQRVVFQGGIQTDYWLTQGGTQAELEALIASSADTALFAIAAGNGGGAIAADPNYLSSVNGLARLETTQANVMSVGSVQARNTRGMWDTAWTNGQLNAANLRIDPGSSRGFNLSIVAPTDAPAIDKYGTRRSFTGTSAANPHIAGIASLVWSVNPNLTGAQVRQILTSTATDLGTAGRDATFGFGLVNADAAVRRAWAIAKDSELANLYSA